MIKTIISDLGNVLLYFNHSILAKSFPGNYTCKDINRLVLDTELDKEYQEGRILTQEFHKKVTCLLGIKMTLEEFGTAYSSIFTEPNKEFIEFLRKVKARYRLLMLSDTNELHMDFVRRKYDFLDIFDDLILSYEVHYSKQRTPQGIFTEAIKRAGCLPEECVFIDDKIEYVKAAGENGLNAIHYVNNEKLFQELESLGIK